MAMNCSSSTSGQDTVLGASSLSPLTIGKEDAVKCQFITREGTYKLFKGDNFRTTAVGYTPPSSQTNSPVKCSFVHIPTSPYNGDLICFNVGKELYVCSYRGTKKATDLNNLIDRRSYKGLYPTCHDFNQVNISSDCVYLLVGLSAGQIQLIDPIKKEISKLYNEERTIDKTKVTCIKWVPGSMNLFLVSHSSGQLYVYKEDLPCGSTVPHYQMFKQGEGFAIYTCKAKSTRNPLYRWVIGEGSINEIAFSPCSKYLATVSQDGFLRVFNYDTMELVGRVRSYFGGLLCVCWSPDSKFVVIGGEDDLITVWSLNEKRVIARGQGHKSWVSVVAFDPYTTTVRDNTNGDCTASDEEELRCEMQAHSLADSTHSQLHSSKQHSSLSSSSSNINKNRSSPSDPGNHLSTHLATLITPAAATTTTLVTSTLTTGNRSNNSKSTNTSTATSTSSSTQQVPPSSTITSYRFGSVGQDTHLCLWELTEDIIKQPVGRSRTSILLHSPTIGSTSAPSCPSLPIVGAISLVSGNCSVNNPVVGSDKSHNSIVSSITAGANCVTNNCNYLDVNAFNHIATTNTTTATSNHTNSKQGESKKEHKRNFSLASRNSDKNSINKASHSKLIDDPIRLLGTPVCPRLDEVPLLEPLICKKIAHERLTVLVFREDCFVAACQEGYIFTWARPDKWENMQIAPSPTPSIEVNAGLGDDNESTVV